VPILRQGDEVTDNLAGDIRKHLYTIADHYDEALEPPRRPQTKMPTETSDGKIRYATKVMRVSPAPISLDVLDARRDALLDIHFWARFVMGEVTDIHGNPLRCWVDGTNMRGMCQFVATWADRLADDHPDEAQDCLEEVAKHAGKLKGYAFPDRRDWTKIGKCPVMVDTDEGPAACGATVRAYEGRPTIECQACGTKADLDWWMSQIAPEGSDLNAAADIIATVAWVADKVLTNEQLWQWATRGHIQRHGKDVKGRTLYSSKAVIEWVVKGVKETVAA
jgi:hypothetical protein